MSTITLRRIERVNPHNRRKTAWYVTKEAGQSVGLSQIAKDIQGRTTQTKSDILATLATFEQLLPIYLDKGLTVRLGGFGSFRISVTSVPSPTEQAVTTRNVKDAHVVFVVGAKVKKMLANISYTIR